MLVAYCLVDGALKAQTVPHDGEVPTDALWLDLVSPADHEDEQIERAVGVEIPTREEMRQIEPSSRLYVEGGAAYMTLSILCGADTEAPSVDPVTFILVKGKLVTVRYANPKPFTVLATRLNKLCAQTTGGQIMMELLDTIVDRVSEVLERAGTDIERLSKRVFERDTEGGNRTQRYRAILTHIGRKEGLLSYARESLASLSRVLAFIGTEGDSKPLGPDTKSQIKSMTRDVAGLSDYANFLGNKLQFLLDGTIGMVGLEQNNIIKIFAVLSVVLMPPTLIASIYGMNFQHMPELAETYGYPIALTAMVISSILPYLFFKWRRWL
ncbi:MAG: magnesium transporter [Rhizobiales bacterium 24-66-13]|jgi:magnesium transporter|uniref:magnesium transporter CorA family protein n=1 Tax=Roseixanthobacter finlandensis TaxID=3119922 RepID=UPI000BD4236C|nr:MAG: magnesium transporter [Rhizobiales bacterium 24-66-13]OZB02824.1 MAG: magnesium transporter [Rhizobiales bacterium 39-66-18]HQS07362.1 magnesium transporter CorA family protein [Xanthobacteraceae bacterium]HQS48744.1 magnesium transporter CorA family protein [Xanthobacteraceae bacterium]